MDGEPGLECLGVFVLGVQDLAGARSVGVDEPVGGIRLTMDQRKESTPSTPAVPCNECAVLLGTDRGRGREPHGNLVRMEDEHLSRRNYKCADCGTVHLHNAVSQTWY